MFEAPQNTSLGHLGAVKQLITIALDLKKWKVDPGAFQSIQLEISGIFYVSKQTSTSCYIAKQSGHLVKWPALSKTIASLKKKMT